MTATLPALKRDRRILRWLLLGLVMLFGGLYVAAYLFTGDRIARGTTVAGVDVGGKTRAGAVAALANLPSAERELSLSADGVLVTVPPRRAGLAVDAEASVAQVVVGRSWDPRDMWEFVSGGSSYDAVETVDDAALASTIARVARQAKEPVVDGAVRFTREGKAVAVFPEGGREVDAAAAREAVLAAYPEHTDEDVELPVTDVEPALTGDEVSRAMREFANPAMSAPVTFRIAGQAIVLEPEDYASALAMRIRDGRLEPVLRPKLLLAAVEPAMDAVALEPEDATVEIVDGVPQVVEGTAGVTFDPEAITSTFLTLVVADGPARSLRVPTKIDTPDLTAEEVSKLGIKEVVSSFTTYYPHADYRNTNIGRAAELINGTILEPGETFSLNDIVGERTAANGFVEGYVIRDGILVQDLGGGVSQVATTTFNAMFFAGLKDVEHKPHSFYIDRYPVGREATVAWPTVDLRFTNDTQYGVLIQAWRTPSTYSTQGSMNVRMWSTKVWDIEAGASDRYAYTSPDTRRLSGPECEPHTGYSGFQIDVYRYFRKPGSTKVVRKETFHTTYTPSDTVICDG
ncbi:MAG TPA: VanW family protein [Nocardioidaceae bacterium]|nr:VanW family protein [Nocardioidaceae bacterium]